MAARHAVYCWDATIPEANASKDALIALFKEHCKKWCFQLEQGEQTGYKHYQCRFTLSAKTRQPIFIRELKGHSSVTAQDNINNYDYVSKDHSRVDGPWKYNDPEQVDLTRDLRVIATWRPWQASIITLCHISEDRKINYIYDPVGNIGKTSLVKYLQLIGAGMFIPPLNDFKDFCQFACSFEPQKAYFVDMPKALDKRKQNSLYAGIETMKSGILYDTRHKGKSVIFDPPVIFVFANVWPNIEYLSRDRWVFYIITPDTQELVETQHPDQVPLEALSL